MLVLTGQRVAATWMLGPHNRNTGACTGFPFQHWRRGFLVLAAAASSGGARTLLGLEQGRTAAGPNGPEVQQRERACGSAVGPGEAKGSAGPGTQEPDDVECSAVQQCLAKYVYMCVYTYTRTHKGFGLEQSGGHVIKKNKAH